MVRVAVGFLSMQALGMTAVGCGGGEPASQGSASATSPSSAAAAATMPPAASTAAVTSTASTASTASAAASASADKPGEGPIARLLADALANPKTYNGKPVKVEGVYLGTKERNIGALVGDSYKPHIVVDVLVADSKDDRAHAIWCEMNKWVPPPGLNELGAVTAEGSGYMDLPAAGVKLVIGNCTITAKAP